MWSKFIITDGTKAGTIDVLPFLKEWLPQLALPKDGGYWSGSAYSQGRQLYDQQLENIIDTFLLNFYTGNQLDTINLLNDFIALLNKAMEYWVDRFQREMVWIEMRPECQTASQYAIIMDWSIPQIDEIFAAPFSAAGTMEDISLIIEHGLWAENEPGSATAIELQGGNPLISATTADKSAWVSGYWDNYPLTHIFVYDAAPVTWTNIAGLSGVNLLPAAPAVGDILYVGVQDTGASSMFDNIVFNIGTAAAGLTIVAEYSTGVGWAALPVAGYAFEDQTALFTNTGRNIVVFDPVAGITPWGSMAINGVTAWWIRFRVSGVAGPVVPTQVTDAIYTVDRPYVDVDALQISGTHAAQAKIKILRQDDTEGHPASGVDPIPTDVIVGLRSLDRGTDFVAFLNANTNPGALPTGVTFSRFAGVLQTDSYSPSYRITRWSPGGASAEVKICDWEIADPQSYEYEGSYRVFLRVSQFGSAEDFRYRVGIQVGSNTARYQLSKYVDGSSTANLAEAETLDFGIMSIHSPISIQDDYSIFLSLWASNIDGGGTSSWIYDLILIPIDEYCAQISLPSGTTIVDGLILDNYLMVDSISDPRILVSGEKYGDPFSASPFGGQWLVNTPSEIFWQVKKDQRLWFLFLDEGNISTGGNGEFYSTIHSANAIQAWRNQRYKMLMGA